MNRAELTALSMALSAKYRGLVVDAALIENPSTPGAPFRQICFRGPRSLLVEFGLIPADGGHHDVLDEFGTRILRGREYAIHQIDPVEWECRGRLPSQHPDNKKTKAIVAKILKRVAAGSLIGPADPNNTGRQRDEV